VAKDTHGNCPHCGVDLNGGSIWQTGYERALQGKHYHQHGIPTDDKQKAEELADEYAAAYGATRTKGQWGREMGIYDRIEDRTVEWQCPDCGGRWARNLETR
jgi:predicted RNA-binding Zn-ribbon protein involved in translation (DUF1610 family)